MQVYCSCAYRIPSSSQKGPVKKGLSVLQSFRPSFRPSFFLPFFLGIRSLFVFFNFGMLLETIMKLYVTELDILGKLFLPQKLGKWTKNRVF